MKLTIGNQYKIVVKENAPEADRSWLKEHEGMIIELTEFRTNMNVAEFIVLRKKRRVYIE